MSLKFSNLKDIKTTIVGLLCLAVAVGGVFIVEDFNVWIFSIALGVGIIMLFSPNKLITGLGRFIKANDDARVIGSESDCEHDHKDDLKQ